jgi:hypothetical protein
MTGLVSLFSPPYLDLVLRAVIRGNSPSRVWVDNPLHPTAGLLWDGGHCVYVVGDARRAENTRRVSGLLAQVAAQAEVAGIHFVKVYLSQGSWEPVIQGVLPGLQRRDRVLLRLNLARAYESSRPPVGFRAEPIDRALLENATLKNLDLVREEISGMWPAVDRFLSDGFGCVVLHDSAVVCWCTAEYVSHQMCGIGIETVPELRGRGLATFAATVVVLECQARGIIAHWDCWRDNQPSLRVAEKVGFDPICYYHVYVGQSLRPAELWSGSILD